MEIILIENVDNLGLRGDIVKVKNGFARNFLIPKKMAIVATPGNIKLIQQQKSKIDTQRIKDRNEAENFRKLLESIQLEVVRKVGEQGVLYGSVTTQEISVLLEDKGYKIDKRKISTDQTIKSPGTFDITIRIHPEVRAVIKLTVYSEETWEQILAERKSKEEAAAATAQEQQAKNEAETTASSQVEKTGTYTETEDSGKKAK